MKNHIATEAKARLERKVIGTSLTSIAFLLSGFLLSSFLFSSHAHADMYVDRSIVIFEKDSQAREDIKVSNSGDENIYVQVEVLQVINPGAENEERVKITDPDKLKLIATPNE